MGRSPCASAPDGAAGPDCAFAFKKSKVIGSKDKAILFMNLVLVSTDARGGKIHKEAGLFLSGGWIMF